MPTFKHLTLAAGLAVLSLNAAASADTVVLTAAGGFILDGNDTTGNNPETTPFAFENLGQTGTIDGVDSITLDIDHTFVGDLTVALRYVPNGFGPTDPTAPFTEAILFDRLNDVTNEAANTVNLLPNNLGGSYSFTPSAEQTLQQAAQPADDDAVLPSGSYLPSDFYENEAGSPLVVDLADLFDGLTLSDGNFYLLIDDAFLGDSGIVNSATLSLTTAVPEPASLAALGLVGAIAGRRRT